ncbi:MAG: ketopantoate reductase family protein [Kiloniellales bacterium]
MKICIIGAGGVGGYFGARLAADGNDVTFVARGAHRAAMEAKGLRVRSPLGDIHIEKPKVLDDPLEIGLCDVVLLCVKLWDTEPAIELARRLLAHDTGVISLQNGVAAEELLAGALGPQHVMGGVAQISAHIAEPGVILHVGRLARIVVGELDGAPSWRQDGLLAACESAGAIEARASSNIKVDIWRKFVLLAPMAGACSLHRAPLGTVLADPARRRQLEALVAEAAAVGRAKGVALAPDTEDKTLAMIAGLPAEMKPSMLLDLEAGRRLELDWLTGAVVRLGRELGVATPESAAVYAALEPYALGGAKEIRGQYT